MRTFSFKRGFTLVEVALFLAVTGALFAGVTVGVQNSIFQQRYNDAVQSFAEFMRGVYAGVLNVQSLGEGNTETAIYGKLVTFGEETNLAGCPVNGGSGGDGAMDVDGNVCTNDRNKNEVFVYDVIGEVGEVESGNVLASLIDLKVNVVEIEDGRLRPVGIVENYSPKWAAQIEQTDGYEIFKGAVLVVRHPSSGTVYTYVLEGETLNVNEAVRVVQSSIVASSDLQEEANKVGDLLRSKMGNGGFKLESVNFCVNPSPGERYLQRRDVRIVKNARNSSGVDIIATEDNPCVMQR